MTVEAVGSTMVVMTHRTAILGYGIVAYLLFLVSFC